MKELIEELEYNATVNHFEGYENIIDLDYIIERLESVKDDLITYIKSQIEENQKMIFEFLDVDEEIAYNFIKAKEEDEKILNYIEQMEDQTNDK